MTTLTPYTYDLWLRRVADYLAPLDPMEQLAAATGYARVLQRDVGLHGDDAAAVAVTALLRVREAAREPVR